MRRTSFVAVAVLFLLVAVAANASDFVRIVNGSVCHTQCYVETPFHITIESADTALITTGTNGFVVTATGMSSWEFVEIRLGPAFEDIGYVVLQDVDSIAPDTFVVGFYDPEGLPAHVDELFFTLVTNIGFPVGEEICVDSTWVPPSYSWQWSGPAFATTPDFLCQYDDFVPGTPHCMFVWDGCYPVHFTLVPPDTGLYRLQGCSDLTFEFQNELVWNGGQPAWCDFRVLEGPGTLIATSYTTSVYSCPPMEAGTYSVWVEIGSCCEFDYCEFDVVFHEEARPDGDCNCDGGVDIDDVVYLIAYIFTGGYEPHANPDCTGLVDIDDVVYLIAYIFSGGPAPCG